MRNYLTIALAAGAVTGLMILALPADAAIGNMGSDSDNGAVEATRGFGHYEPRRSVTEDDAMGSELTSFGEGPSSSSRAAKTRPAPTGTPTRSLESFRRVKARSLDEVPHR